MGIATTFMGLVYALLDTALLRQLPQFATKRLVPLIVQHPMAFVIQQLVSARVSLDGAALIAVLCISIAPKDAQHMDIVTLVRVIVLAITPTLETPAQEKIVRLDASVTALATMILVYVSALRIGKNGAIAGSAFVRFTITATLVLGMVLACS